MIIADWELMYQKKVYVNIFITKQTEKVIEKKKENTKTNQLFIAKEMGHRDSLIKKSNLLLKSDQQVKQNIRKK